MIPSKINPLGIDQNYPLMHFEKDGNLFDINATLNNFLYSNGDGTYTVIWLAGGRAGNFFNVDIKAGEPYTTSINIISSTSSGLSTSIQIEYVDGTFGGIDISGTGQKYVNKTETKDIVRMRVLFVNVNTAQGQSTIFKDFMIKKGTTTAYPTYEPYNPHTYSVEGQSTQEVRSVSKNLYNLQSITYQSNANAYVDNGRVILTATSASTSYALTDWINLKAGVTYIRSFEFDAKGTSLTPIVWWFTGGGTIVSQSNTYTPDSDIAVRLGFYVWVGHAIGDTVEYYDIQIELGTTSTPYQPFVPLAPSPSPQYLSAIISNYPKGVYKTPWGYIRLYEDLRGIGSYRDKITYNKADGTKLLTKRALLRIFDGSVDEEWQIGTTDITPSKNTSRFYLSLTDAMLNGRCLSSRFEEKFPGNFGEIAISDAECCNISNGAFSQIRILKSRLSGFDEGLTNAQKINLFKTWLSNNPVACAYQLQTPINQEL